MKKKIGITLFALSIFSMPSQVFAEFKLDNKSYHYGFFIGSLSETCILYQFGNLSGEDLRETYQSIFSSLRKRDKKVENRVFKFANDKKFYCKDFVPLNY